MTSFLHIDGSSHSSIGEMLSDKLGRFGEFLDEVLIHSFTDTLKLVLFLFFTYLFMEFVEHVASDGLKSTMNKAGIFGPIVGGVFGAVPQCGFSAVAANLYSGRVITFGTLIAVFLSTSDEMLPILIAGNVNINKLLPIIIYKCAVGIAVGLLIDIAMRVIGMYENDMYIDDIDDCSCGDDGIFVATVKRTLSVSLFVFLITAGINALFFFVGESALSGSLFASPFVSHIISAIVGLIPNCASSIALTKLAMSGVISTGAMMSGLFAGSGVGLLVLFKMNKRPIQNVFIMLLLIAVGAAFGLLADLIGISIV